MNVEKPYTCPHCGAKLLPWRSPEMTSWGGDIQYICFSDECEYFIRGWNWMQENFEQTVSYRHRFDPLTGDSGPIPVWSKSALKDLVIEEEEIDE